MIVGTMQSAIDFGKGPLVGNTMAEVHLDATGKTKAA